MENEMGIKGEGVKKRQTRLFLILFGDEK